MHTSFAVKVPPTFRRGAVSFKQSRQRLTHLVERLQNGINRGDDQTNRVDFHRKGHLLAIRDY